MEKPCAIITGGNRGIGKSITKSFLAAGYRVAVVSRGGEIDVDSSGSVLRTWKCDLREVGAFASICNHVSYWAGRVDVLVNNAGLSSWRPLEKIDEAFWDDMISINLKSVLFCSQGVLPYLTNSGSIINISSLAGKRGSANNSVYCAAKFGVNGLTQALAKELGGRGIRVNALCPVYVETLGLHDALKEPEAPSSGQPVDSYLQNFATTNAALKRLPTASEIGATCVFLASPSASAITGQCINIDCGVFPQ